MAIAVPSDGIGASSIQSLRATTHLPGIAVAAAFSFGAGAVHAGAIGIHAEHATLARLFVGAAVFQLGWGIVALLRPSRLVAAIGALGNLGLVGAWLVTRLTGISSIGGLEVREAAQFTDTACALLGLVAAGAALSALLIGWRATTGSSPKQHLVAGLAVAALTVSAMVTGSSHVHAEGTMAATHEHGTAAPVSDSGDGLATPTTEHNHSTDTSHSTDTTGSTDTTVNQHTSNVATVPYDPTKPIDLGGVKGVTPEQQAIAENLVAVNLIRLPKWNDPATAEAAGFHSIGDGATGHEHYLNWDWINDDVILDPDHPESLVYAPQPDGSKKLVSAMYMLPDTVGLADVPELGGALTQWHIHDNLCFSKDPSAPRVAGLTDSEGNCPEFLQKFPPAAMIHVWITSHPCGPFAALEGVGAGQILEGETRLCDEAHGSH